MLNVVQFVELHTSSGRDHVPVLTFCDIFFSVGYIHILNES